jgi:hypothetical protein
VRGIPHYLLPVQHRGPDIGKAKAAIPLSMLRDVILLIAFPQILPVRLGETGIFGAAPAADILAIAITAVVVVRMWKRDIKGMEG